MQSITGEGTMSIGGAVRPYYIGTRQTATFCELQGDTYDLQDYNGLLGEVFGNNYRAQQAKDTGESFTPVGRKELTPGEVRDFVYSALHAGVRRAGGLVDFEPDDVADWIDEADASEVMKPVITHLALLAQKLQRQQVGNVLAPASKAKRGQKTTRA